MPYPPQGAAAGITKLSELGIDTSKDWLSYLIKNIGAPTVAGDALRKGTRVTAAELLDGTSGLVLTGQGVGVNPIYAAVVAGNPDLLITYILNGTAVFLYAEEAHHWATCFPDTYTDLAIQTYVALGSTGDNSVLRGRITGTGNMYVSSLYEGGAAADHKISKAVAGTWTLLTTEAVDIYATIIRSMKLSCLGTSIKSYRADLATAKLTATDTSLTSGKFGIGQNSAHYTIISSAESYLHCRKVAAGSPSPMSIGYFEVPIIGAGTTEDPYRVKMPEFIEELPVIGKTNRLALTHSSLIPTDDRGQPLHSTALVRILAQPARQAHLETETTCITALKALAGIGEIAKVNVKARAKGMDIKLKDDDLTPDAGWD